MNGSESVQVFFIICLYIYVLPLENQLSSGEGQDLINWCNMLHFCGRLKPGPKFQTSYVVVFIFDQLVVVRGDSLIVHFVNVDIGGIVDHHCLNFLFIIYSPCNFNIFFIPAGSSLSYIKSTRNIK